jgi:hypothetical protein
MAILMISNEAIETSDRKYYQIVSHDIEKLLKIHFPVAFSLGYDMTVDVTYELAVLILHSKGTHGPKHISRMNISCGVLEQIPTLTLYCPQLHHFFIVPSFLSSNNAKASLISSISADVKPGRSDWTCL